MSDRGDFLLDELTRLTFEAQTVYRELVLPGWGGPRHGMPDTLFGYVAGAFARTDLASALWKGSGSNDSRRMVDFLTHFASVGRREASVAVNIWRHKLVHTSAPRVVHDRTTGQDLHWLLHWGDEHLPRSDHFRFQSNDVVLNLSLFGLLETLRTALVAYVEALRRDATLQTRYDATLSRIEHSHYKAY